MKTYTYTKSDEMLSRAAKVIPSGVYGHLGPAEGCFIPISAFPKFSDKAKGSYFWDVDGNRFIDYMCAYGPNVLGYGDDDVDRAFAEQARIANCTTSPSYKMVEFAEKLVDKVKSADWAFFAKNGSDVTTLAMLTARVATGKSKMIFVKNYYHGVHQWTQTVDAPWVVPGEVDNKIMVEFNDIEAVKEAIAKHKDEIGAFIATPYMHGNFVDNILPQQGYWQEVRKLCTENGIVLIIDDVRCGFRLDTRGSDYYYGFEADLICFCKALANGYSVSALCGKDFLKSSVTGISYTGSYWLSAAHFAAGIACLEKMEKLGGSAKHNELGKKVCKALQDAAINNGVTLSITGEPSLFYTMIKNDDSLVLHQEWISEVVKRGVFMTNHHNHFTNLSLTDEDINFTGEVADEAFKVLVKNHPEIDWTIK
ncbi:MAG: aminotransferase class III-fold pyridoxal phosphate-dependent enzyme [Anaerovoracaceae bacterium]